MEIWSPIAYWFAVLIIATFPPAIVYWVIIHPFADFWRRLGRAMSFTIVGLACIAMAIGIGMQHERLLAVHWGFHWPMIVVGVALYGFGIYGEQQIRKQLKFSILVGAPELSSSDKGALLTGGVYGRCRNPRYVNIIIVLVGWSLILNYPAIYVVAALCIPALYLVTLLEERELRARFGTEYEEYCRRVPRFIPRPGEPS